MNGSHSLLPECGCGSRWSGGLSKGIAAPLRLFVYASDLSERTAMKNLMDMMKQARELQDKMAEMQNAVAEISRTGTAGAGLVSITLNGKGAMTEVKIDPSLLKDSEREILEDLIAAAHGDAKARIEEILQRKMQELAGDLPLPPGMKLF
jgi:DNA-binding YbaB/EbfC family protein